MDTLGHLPALPVTLINRLGQVNQQEQHQVAESAEAVQEVTNENVTLAYLEQGYTGDEAGEGAAAQGIRLEVVRHAEAKN